MVPSWNHRHIFHSSSDFFLVESAPCSAPGHLLGGCFPHPYSHDPQAQHPGDLLSPHWTAFLSHIPGPKPHPAQGPSGQPGLSQVKFNLGWKGQRAEIKRSLYFKGGGGELYLLWEGELPCRMVIPGRQKLEKWSWGGVPVLPAPLLCNSAFGNLCDTFPGNCL